MGQAIRGILGEGEMTPYYDKDGITIYLGDCLKIMPKLNPGFDAIIADLPYGVTRSSWDNIIPLEPLWVEYRRLIKTGGVIVLNADDSFATELKLSNQKWYRYRWIWVKNQPTGIGIVNFQPMRCAEDILIFYKSFGIFNKQLVESKILDRHLGKPNGKFYANNSTGVNVSSRKMKKTSNYENILLKQVNPRNILEFDVVPHSKGTYHPNQKPIALLSYLIRTYTNPDNLILDNAMGSGTTLVAAQNEGRRAVGIEISEEYCKIAVERLRQKSLFGILRPELKQEPKQLRFDNDPN